MQEFTNYHFDVKPNALYGALDRFAQFFIDPLCKADALEREVMAVDNEFSGKATSTISQAHQQSHLMCTANRVWEHLFHARSHHVLTSLSGQAVTYSCVTPYRGPTE